jgi:hypothetical protein
VKEDKQKGHHFGAKFKLVQKNVNLNRLLWRQMDKQVGTQVISMIGVAFVISPEEKGGD